MIRLRDLPRDAHFRRGARDMMPFGPGLAAWGLVTGVAMTQSGLGVGLSLLMTFTVYSGSAQLASLPLIASGAPMWVIWASAFCINLRFAIFSSHWRVHLGHLPRRRRVVARLPAGRPEPGRLPEALEGRGPPRPARRAMPPAARSRYGSSGSRPRSPASCSRRWCRSNGAWASPARCRCSAWPIRCSTSAPPGSRRSSRPPRRWRRSRCR